jgi:hypothetical protein
MGRIGYIDGSASGGDTATHENLDAGEVLIWIAGLVLVGISMSIAVAGWF